MPRQHMIISSSTPAISVRSAIKVIGGMVATPSLMKLQEAPHSVASNSNSTSSPVTDVPGERNNLHAPPL